MLSCKQLAKSLGEGTAGRGWEKSAGARREGEKRVSGARTEQGWGQAKRRGEAEPMSRRGEGGMGNTC